MSLHPVKLLLVLLLLTVATPPLALTSDRNQPIRITADQMLVDERKGISHYQGDVYLKQGSLEIRSDELTVHIDAGKVEKIIVTGQPARLQQQPDERPTVYSSANRMEYDTGSGELLLIEDARVKQGANTFSGARIEYDTINSIVAARKDEEEDDGRVHAIIEPADKSQDDNQ